MKRLEPLAFVFLFASLGYTLFAWVPASDLRDLTKVETHAAFAAILVAVVLLALRVLPERRPRIERFIYAAFLAGMPFVYIVATLVHGDTRGLALEAIGVPVFVGLAAYGYARSFAVLAAGIVAHGVAWDLWHHHSAAYIAPWYPSACLVADLAMGWLASTQASAHSMSERAPR